jgi:hypothetical protein
MTEQSDPEARKRRLEERTGSSDGHNMDARGVMPEGRRVVEPDDPDTLDAELDSSPRTDGTGGPEAGADVPDQGDVLPAGMVERPTRQVQQSDDPDAVLSPLVESPAAVDEASPDRRVD